MAKRASTGRRQGTRRRGHEPFWADHADQDLLALRLCDLGIAFDDTVLEARLERLHAELQGKGLRLKPHAWLSTEWFSPDGVPGIALPFYLAHPRLMKLERKQMLDVEGGTERACMKLLRHEAGHAIATAFRLPYRRGYQRTFGTSRPYPTYYKPRPVSRKYVLHLDHWYAQSHPSEDFAETFAVWLSPRNRWRQRYAGWPALKKLEYVDELMKELQGRVPPVRSRRKPEPLSRETRTLGEFYDWKREYYGTEHPHVYDRHLKRLFSDAPEHKRRETAVSFIRRVRTDVRELVGQWTGLPVYTIDQVLRDMIGRCKELKLRVHESDRKTKLDMTVMLTVQTMSYLYSGRHKLAL